MEIFEIIYWTLDEQFVSRIWHDYCSVSGVWFFLLLVTEAFRKEPTKESRFFNDKHKGELTLPTHPEKASIAVAMFNLSWSFSAIRSLCNKWSAACSEMALLDLRIFAQWIVSFTALSLPPALGLRRWCYESCIWCWCKHTWGACFYCYILLTILSSISRLVIISKELWWNESERHECDVEVDSFGFSWSPKAEYGRFQWGAGLHVWICVLGVPNRPFSLLSRAAILADLTRWFILS